MTWQVGVRAVPAASLASALDVAYADWRMHFDGTPEDLADIDAQYLASALGAVAMVENGAVGPGPVHALLTGIFPDDARGAVRRHKVFVEVSATSVVQADAEAT